MLTAAQFAEQQRQLGCRIHEHGGVFWEEIHPFYCKPAFPYQCFARGTARPVRRRSMLGFSHPVPCAEQGNRRLPLMVLEREQLDGYGLSKLPSKKRNQVRRALEQCVVLPILDLESQLECIREINIAQATRQERGAGAEVPASRYIQEADAWRTQIRNEFRVGTGREWWGAFVDGHLAAYVRTHQVDGIRVIQQAKANTLYFKANPMDALYFTVLSKAAEDADCRRIINGSPLHESVNHFKRQFLFQSAEYPIYSSNVWLLEMAKRLMGKGPRSATASRATAGEGDKTGMSFPKDPAT